MQDGQVSIIEWDKGRGIVLDKRGGFLEDDSEDIKLNLKVGRKARPFVSMQEGIGRPHQAAPLFLVHPGLWSHGGTAAPGFYLDYMQHLVF